MIPVSDRILVWPHNQSRRGGKPVPIGVKSMLVWPVGSLVELFWLSISYAFNMVMMYACVRGGDR
jgi:hypothetical protein